MTDAERRPDERTDARTDERTDERTDAPPPAPARRRSPVVRWISGLSQAAYAGIVLAVIVALLLVAVAVNRGERVGPVRPADPPVGGPGLPATRL